MNCPALASPGGDSGVRTPIFTGFWARAGAASPHATIATSTAAALVGHVRPLIESLRRSPRSLSTPMPSRVSARVRALLRVGASVMLPSTAPREAAGIEEREVEGGLAVREPLGDIPAGGGRVLEAVAAEAEGEEDALDAGRPADDRVVVGRERPEARPAAGDPRVLEDRQAMDRLLHRVLDLPPVHRDVEVLADVFDVARAQQNLLHFFPEVEAARHVARERHRTRDLGKRLGEEDVATPRVSGKLEPREPPDARRGGTRGVDDDRRGDRALGGLGPRDAPVRLLERRHLHALEDLHAELARSARERVGHLGGPGHAVLGPPERRDQVVHAEGGDELLRVGGRGGPGGRAQRSVEAGPPLGTAGGPPPGGGREGGRRPVTRGY